MPIVRYQLRDVHASGDPRLYTSNIGDEPQALLRGVAAAGLIGVLRQLGDLAEFAAEIFHNLHEDVISVVERGDGLSLRVQQLETEIPKIEKDFLSQIDHSMLADHESTDWHPRLHANSNLITKGDLPKFILDSYDECRGPPRLFILDKFDSAGAGACLRRYSDPSFFRTSSFYSKLTQSEYRKENKFPKKKVKVPRPRNDEIKGHNSASDISLKLIHMVAKQGHPEKCIRLKIRPPNYLNEYGEDSEEHIIESYSPKTSFGSSHSAHEDQGFEIESPSSNQMQQENKELSCCSEQMEDTGMVKMKFHTPTSAKPINQETSHNTRKAHRSPGNDSTTKTYVSSSLESVSLTDEENRVDGSTDGYLSADVSSDMETFSYVDALTTESDCEAESDRKLDPEMKSHLREDQAVQFETTNLVLKDAKNVHAVNRSPESPREYKGSKSVLEAGSSEHSKAITELETEAGPKKGMRVVNGDPSLHVGRRLKKAAIDEGHEVGNAVSSEVTYGSAKMSSGENGRDSDSSLKGNIPGKSRGCMSLPSMPPLAGSSSSSMSKRRHARSLELDGVQPNVGIKGNNKASSLPPLPPTEWREGKMQFDPSLHHVSSANTQNGSGTNLPAGEPSLQTHKSDVQNLLVEEREVSDHIPSSNTEMITPTVVTSAVENARDIYEHEHENKAVSLNNISPVTGLSTSGESGRSTLQPPANFDTEISLSTVDSQGHSPSSAREPESCSSTAQTANKTMQNYPSEKTEKESTSEFVTATEVVAAEMTNGKPNRPRDPLIEAVASHDKSRMRKVFQASQISNKLGMGQRDALLEEIRSKAFALRPTSIARPSIKGPVTNTIHAAMVEKAKQIRVAFIGSDEEDDGNWD